MTSLVSYNPGMGRAANNSLDLFTGVLGERRGLSKEQERLAPEFINPLNPLSNQGLRLLMAAKIMLDKGASYTSLDLASHEALYGNGDLEERRAVAKTDLEDMVAKGVCEAVGDYYYNIREMDAWPVAERVAYKALLPLGTLTTSM